VFASEIMHGAPHLSADLVEQLNSQAKHNIDCIQTWIDRGQIAPIDPNHLMFSIWAATQTYADFDWQITAMTGKAKLDEEDYSGGADDHPLGAQRAVSRTQTSVHLSLAGQLPQWICERHRIRGSWLASDDFRSAAKDQAATPASALNPTPRSL
jgi:AcrR family transcriptional regulator